MNLHYLVTAYGNKAIPATNPTLYDDVDAQFVLGSAMRVLHDVPIVTDGVTSIRPPSGTLILDKTLRDGYERIRLSLEPLTLEDVTKVWTALALRYRLSAAYLVNVVQIESRRQRAFPRPVGQPTSSTAAPLASDPPAPGPWIYAMTIQAPTISEVRVRRQGETVEQPFPYARIDDTLVLHGTSLAGPETRVVFGDVTVSATYASPLRVEAPIPNLTVPGAGAIPAEKQLQPGVRTVRVVARDPQVPQSSFSSNDAVFMLVPSVDPLNLNYSAVPTRRIEINGERLIGTNPGGETMIGRSTVPRAAYFAESQTRLLVPIPATLPSAKVQAQVGALLATDPVPIGAGPYALRINIGGTVATRTRDLPASLALGDVARIVAGMIHDARPDDPRFSGARVELWAGRLVLIPGDLTSTIAVDASGGSGLAAALGLTPVTASANAYVSGLLTSPPPLSSPAPRIQLKVGAAVAVLEVARTTSLDALALDLQAKLNALPAAAFAGARVGTSSSQLVLIPGAAGAVSFAAVPGVDDRTVVELQLHAQFAVRVRVNGAESFDPAVVDLPQ